MKRGTKGKRSSSSRRQSGGGGRGRKQARHLEGVTQVDFRDTNLLRRFVTEHGKIMPARLTGANSRQQRQLAKAIRRARVMGLMT